MSSSPLKRKHSLIEEGAKADGGCVLGVAPSFQANEGRYRLLEASPEILAALKAGETLVFKGGSDADAVLCTGTQTRRIQKVRRRRRRARRGRGAEAGDPPLWGPIDFDVAALAGSSSVGLPKLGGPRAELRAARITRPAALQLSRGSRLRHRTRCSSCRPPALRRRRRRRRRRRGRDVAPPPTRGASMRWGARPSRSSRSPRRRASPR